MSILFQTEAINLYFLSLSIAIVVEYLIYTKKHDSSIEKSYFLKKDKLIRKFFLVEIDTD